MMRLLYSIFVPIVIILIHLTHKDGGSVLAACTGDEFECNNGNCVADTLVNNTVNDCVDNSDEGFQWSCQRSGEFKCTTGVGDAGLCFAGSYRLDGLPDCPDLSDEEKYVGTICNQFDGACCPCEDFIAESECDDTNVCACMSGRYSNELGTECIVRILGDACTIHADCFDAVDNTICDGGICLCQLGWYPSSDNFTSDTYCIIRELYDACDVDVDCSAVIDFSNCTRGMCLCENGYAPGLTNTTCYRRDIGDDCSLNTDCFPSVEFSYCDDTTDTCQCEYLYRDNNEDYVCATYLLEDTCDNTTQCAFGVANSNCTADICQCNSGYLDYSLSNCTLRRIDDECTLNTDCTDAVSNSNCDANMCTCDVGYYASDDRTECLAILIDDPCTATADCEVFLNDSICDAGTCVCSTAYYAQGNDTCEARGIGDACVSDEECRAIAGAYECTGAGMCGCPQEYLPADGDTECAERQVGDPCTVTSQCGLIGNAACNGTHCVCEDGYLADSDTCRVRGIGESCDSDEDCSAVNDAYCDIDGNGDGECQCNSGLIPNDAQMQCVDSVTSMEPSTEIAASAEEATNKDDSCDFICQYPWAIVLLLAAVAAIVIFVILLVKRPACLSKKNKKKPDKNKISPALVYGDKATMAFPSWPNKPKQHVMYNDDDDVMKVKDIDIDDETAGVYIKEGNGLVFASMAYLAKRSIMTSSAKMAPGSRALHSSPPPPYQEMTSTAKVKDTTVDQSTA